MQCLMLINFHLVDIIKEKMMSKDPQNNGTIYVEDLRVCSLFSYCYVSASEDIWPLRLGQPNSKILQKLNSIKEIKVNMNRSVLKSEHF